jgi:cation:H+ antiporter
LAATGGGALIGLGTALPEISLNVTSTTLGWPDIGLGAALGSNLPAIPLAFAAAYLSMRAHGGRAAEGPSGEPALAVEPEAVWRHALPYIGALVLVAVLTLPPPLAGLQPIDGAILIAAWAAYMAQALLRGRGAPQPGRFKGWAKVALGGATIAGGAVLAVLGSEQINRALGLSDFTGGLFITGMLCALPESFSAWRLARDGRATAALSGVLADGTTSISLAFVPLCVAGSAVGDAALYALNLGFVAAFVLAYVALSHRAFAGRRFTGAQVASMGALYGVYLAAYALVASA